MNLIMMLSILELDFFDDFQLTISNVNEVSHDSNLMNLFMPVTILEL